MFGLASIVNELLKTWIIKLDRILWNWHYWIPFVFYRVLQPPGGGSSNLFGGYEDDAGASRKPNKMASKVFAPPEQPQNVPRRSNPPGQAILSGQINMLRQASQ